MSRYAAALQKHCEELVRLNERLLRLAGERTAAMARRDEPRLELLLAEERQTGLALGEEERRRQMTLIHLARELGLRAEEMTRLSLADVAARLGGERGAALLALRDRLRQLAGETQRANQTALQLAQRFLPYFEELLSVLLDGSVGQLAYTPGGQAARAGAAGLNVLDVKA